MFVFKIQNFPKLQNNLMVHVPTIYRNFLKSKIKAYKRISYSCYMILYPDWNYCGGN